MNLQIRKSGLYSVRLYVPGRLKSRLGRTEIIIGLGTANRIEAEQRLVAVKYLYLKIYAMCDACPDLSGEVLLDMARRHFKMSLEKAREAYATTSLGMAGCPPDFLPGEILAEDFKNAAQRLDTDIALNRLEAGQEAVAEMLGQGGHSLPEGHPKLRVLALYALHAIREQARYSASLYRNGLDVPGAWEVRDPLLREAERASGDRARHDSSTSSPIATEDQGTSLEELVAQFLRDQTQGLKKRTIEKYREHLDLAVRFLGRTTPAHSITRKQVRDFRSILPQLPTHFSKRFPRLAPAELAALADKEKLPRLKPGSVNTYLSTLSQLFRFGESLGYMAMNLTCSP